MRFKLLWVLLLLFGLELGTALQQLQPEQQQPTTATSAYLTPCDQGLLDVL
jgi:hypothetical protein